MNRIVRDRALILERVERLSQCLNLLTSSQPLSGFETGERSPWLTRKRTEGPSPESAKELRMRFWSHLKICSSFKRCYSFATRTYMPVSLSKPITPHLQSGKGLEVAIDQPQIIFIDCRNVVPSPTWSSATGTETSLAATVRAMRCSPGHRPHRFRRAARPQSAIFR